MDPGILIDLGDFAKNRLLPLILIVVVVVGLVKLWRRRAG